MLKAVRQAIPRLSAQEAVIARRILVDPDLVLDSTAAELATASGTSPATVARFSQHLGFSGYRQFRLACAAAVSRERAERDRFELHDEELSQDDNIDDVIAKILFQEVLAIEQTLRGLDRSIVTLVVDALLAARRIEITGFGASGLIAADLNEKLRRIGLLSSYSADLHFALPSASTLVAGDVLVAFSHGGRTLETRNVLRVAQGSGATTVAISNDPGSPLAESADHTIVTRARERTFRTGAMASRSAQSSVADVLLVCVAQRNLATTSEALRRTYDSILEHRTDP
ncbi:MAG: MurR/RpiR family transcriptional regulator [Propioniciclava sp.]